MNPRVTFRDIAAVANVHVSTVSLAMRNSPRITPEVRQRIKAIADRLGYQPDPILAALNAYRKTVTSVHYQSTIAWIDNWLPGELRRLAPFNEYFLGAQQRARQVGYEVEEFSLHQPKMTSTKLISILKSRNIRGILVPPQPHPRMALDFDFDQFAAVAFGYTLHPQRLHLVTTHHVHSMLLLTENLYRLGYRRIGWHMWDALDEKVDNGYSMAYTLFHRKYGLKQTVPRFAKEVANFDKVHQWILKYKPDAIISQYDSLPRELKKRGIEIPRDIGFTHISVGADDVVISGVHEKGREIGTTAVDLLVGMLQRGEFGLPETPLRILVEGVWREGTTTCPQEQVKQGGRRKAIQ